MVQSLSLPRLGMRLFVATTAECPLRRIALSTPERNSCTTDATRCAVAVSYGAYRKGYRKRQAAEHLPNGCATRCEDTLLLQREKRHHTLHKMKKSAHDTKNNVVYLQYHHPSITLAVYIHLLLEAHNALKFFFQVLF